LRARGKIAASITLLVPLLPTGALLAAGWALAWVERGSIAAGDWLPYALLALLVLATVLFAGAAAGVDRAALVALAALLGLAGLAALSLTWSPVPSLARDEALLTAFYTAVVAVPLLSLRTPFERLSATGLVVAGLGALAVATAVEMRFADRPVSLYYAGRLDFPVSYVNGQAGLLLVGFWPAVMVAARRSAPVVARGLALAAAVALLGGGLLSQSKGSALGLGVSAVLIFALGPGRLRLLVPAAGAAVFVAVVFRPLTAPFRAHTDAAEAAAIRHAGTILLLLTALALVAGIGYALADRRLELSAPTRRAAEVVALAAVVAGFAGGAIGFFAAIDHPIGYATAKWDSFKHPPQHREGSSHLVTLGSNRYDFWRVAGDEFVDHPLVGIGSRGFIAAYLRHRRSPETPARVHSLPLEVLTEDGLVGFALFLAAIGVPLVVLARRRADLASFVAFAAGAYWLAHASVDWLWTLPAVGLPFFLLLGIGLAGDRAPPHSRVRIAAAVAVIVVAALAFLPPWLSARLTSWARSHPASAATDLRWARRLDPLSIEPLVAQYELSRSPRQKIDAARRAIDREPDWVLPHYLLGLAYLADHRKGPARRELALAHRLDPREQLIVRALRRAR
jgi:hypothetical protein